MLDPEQYYLLEEFCENEKIPMMHPEWSKVVAAIDKETEKIVGIVVCQMQLHLEPIWIKKNYQGKGLWQMMADAMEGYLEMLAWGSGQSITVWNQPTNGASERICRLREYVKGDRPLWYKVYDGSVLGRSIEAWHKSLPLQLEE